MKSLNTNFSKRLLSGFSSYKTLFNTPLRFISAKAYLQEDDTKVRLRGTYLPGKQKDLPTLIWLPEVLESAESYESFFNRPDNRIREIRNVWLLNYRNNGDSDHHASFALEDMANDIVRFMDENKITLATIGGLGFGAKVATVTAINNMDRFTGLVLLEGGPVDQRHHEAYLEFKSYIQAARDINLQDAQLNQVHKILDDKIEDPKWRDIFKKNLTDEKGPVNWKSNIEAIFQENKKFQDSIAYWDASYGLWPGQVLALFASYSRWVLLNTNTLPFYNVFPRLEGQFSDAINIHGSDETAQNHWITEHPEDEVGYLANRMCRWLRWQDGTHVLLADKSEAGTFYIPDRGAHDPNITTIHGEYTPEHVHHNYLYTDAYEQSRKSRGKETAAHGQFLQGDKFTNENKW